MYPFLLSTQFYLSNAYDIHIHIYIHTVSLSCKRAYKHETNIYTLYQALKPDISQIIHDISRKHEKERSQFLEM